MEAVTVKSTDIDDCLAAARRIIAGLEGGDHSRGAALRLISYSCGQLDTLWILGLRPATQVFPLLTRLGELRATIEAAEVL